ncbi:hypothetical protein BC940DRAFT_314962 [Gongronella butleri]|nr:hypothetical protein BC940DRAFT_314962 [Gongronella butleri]
MADQVYTMVHNKVVERMGDCSLPTGQVQHVVGALLTGNATVEEHETFMNDNYLVSDAIMVRILGLQPAPDVVPVGQVCHYVRCWTIPFDVVNTITTDLSAQVQIEEVEDWIDHLALRNEDDEPLEANDALHFRYVGMVKGPRTPHDRVVEDANQAGGLYGHFLAAIGRLDPADQARIQFQVLVLPGTFEEHPAVPQPHVSLDDVREQVMIAYFDLNKLLNQQPGGFYQHFEPSAEDVHAHNVLYPTGLHWQLKFLGAVQNPVVTNNVQAWHNRLLHDMQQDQAVAAVIARVQDGHQGQEYMQTVREQATPKVSVFGRTLLCGLGSDCTEESAEAMAPFFTNFSRAGYVAVQSFGRAYNLDQTSDPEDNDGLGDLMYRDPFQMVPFLDVFPWPKSTVGLELALNQVTDYLQTVQPVVTVAFSKQVTSMAKADFLHSHGLTTTDAILDSAGLPFICRYPGQAWVNNADNVEMPAEHATIVVPHVHPGYAKHGAYSRHMFRIYDLQWKITFLLAEIAAKLIRLHHHFERHISNFQLCQEILFEAANDRALSEAHEALRQAKDAHRAFMVQRLARQARRTPLTDTRSHQLAAIARVQGAPQAQGAPGSPDRIAQANALWRLNLPQLHIHIGRDFQQMWLQWALQLAEGTNMYMSSFRHAGMAHEQHPAMHLLLLFAPDDADEQNSWLDDPAQVLAARQRWSRHVLSFLPPDVFSFRNQLERGVRSMQQRYPHTADARVYEPLTVMENRLIRITERGWARLIWNDEEMETERTLGLHFPQQLFPLATFPNDTGDGRKFRLRIKENGFGVDMLSGNPVHNENDNDVLLTLSSAIGRTSNAAEGQHLRRMHQIEWERLHPQQQPLDAANAILLAAGTGAVQYQPGLPLAVFNAPHSVQFPPPEEIDPPSKAPFRARTNLVTRNNFGTIRDVDGIGLLRLFLDTEFPDGGTLHTADNRLIGRLATTRPAAQPLFTLFRAFCVRFPSHPWSEWWIDKLDRLPIQGGDFRANIVHLRIVAQDGIENYRDRGPGQLKCIIITFGGPVPGRQRQ